ncbi:MAG: hypothetical protein WDN28_25885 [Chthoniobacter sp.]
MKTPAFTSARLGKIARLPFHIRQWINESLDDGQPAKSLLRPLNADPDVRRCLKKFFDGRPINAQNLTAWKQGGFLDYQRHQRSRAVARDLLDEANELEEEVRTGEMADPRLLLDRVTDRMALALLQIFREVQAEARSPEGVRTLLGITRELARLRWGDHERQRTEIDRQRWRHEQAVIREKAREKEQQKREHSERVVRTYGWDFRREYINGLADETLTPERRQWIESYFAANAEVLEKLGVDPLPTGEQMDAAREQGAHEAAKSSRFQGDEAEMVERIRSRFENGHDFISPESDQGDTEGESSQIKAD